MTAVGKKCRKQMEFILPRRIERRDWNCGAARLADAQQTAEVPEDDVAVTVPRAAHRDTPRRQIAQGLRQTARHIQLLQLPAGVERDEPSVRRPKRRRHGRADGL